MRKTSVAILALFVLGLAAPPASAQGMQTGALSGTITTPDGASLPDTTISLRSPVLQGMRTAHSDARGAYIVHGLSAGTYTVTFEHPGIATVTRQVPIATGSSTLDLVMRPAELREAVDVTAPVESDAREGTLGGQAYRASRIDKLAMPRSPFDIAELAPGLTNNTPNPGQLTISGGFAYDTEALVDGVDVSDNTLGTANRLFIEDAIQEVQVLTSGISSEYGHFGGGVVNTVTKTGGNELSGSVRLDLANPGWSALTPFEEQGRTPADGLLASYRPDGRQDRLQKTVQGTLGGPVLKDRLWFFAAARHFADDEREVADFSNLRFDQATHDNRYLLRLTGAVTPQHTLQATYTRNDTSVTQPSSAPQDSFGTTYPLDSSTIEEVRLPQSLLVARYGGTLDSGLFVEAQYSQKTQAFNGVGGTSRDIRDSPFIVGLPTGPTGAVYAEYNAPSFDATDPEERNNRQWTTALSYLLSTRSFGTHDLKVGLERFETERRGGGSGSSTGYTFVLGLPDGSASPAVVDGRFQPLFTQGTSLYEWKSTPGAAITIATDSVYLNDRWRAGRHWSGTLGLRGERVEVAATGTAPGRPTQRLAPRLSVSHDLRGDGRWRIDSTFSWYAGKYNDAQFGRISTVANAPSTVRLYEGPTGSGRDFAPGFDLANYSPDPTNPSFGKGTTLATGLASPLTVEWTLGAEHTFDRGTARVVYVHRGMRDFVDDFVDHTTGETPFAYPLGGNSSIANKVYENTNGPTRVYDALVIASDQRITPHLQLSVGYTLQIRNEGDFEGEAPNAPAISSIFGNYPELRVPQNNPVGPLKSFQRHKLRAYGTYALDLPRHGQLELGVVYRYDSPRTYSLILQNVGPSEIQIARDTTYPNTSGGAQDVFFGGRGAYSFEAEHLFDLSATYSLPLRGRSRWYVKAEARNALNAHPLTAAETRIGFPSGDPSTWTFDANGLPATYTKVPGFGEARSSADYPAPRTFLLAFGLRF